MRETQEPQRLLSTRRSTTMVKEVATCGSHLGVLSVFEPAETAGQGQGPLAINVPAGGMAAPRARRVKYLLGKATQTLRVQWVVTAHP